MHQYLASGLDYVWLQNGYTEQDSPYGPTIAFADIDGLHKTIALALVERAGRLTGKEIRFLRHQMEMSQAALAEVIGVTSQSIALWEKGRGNITGPSDMLLRLIIKAHYSGSVTVRRAIDALNHRDAHARSGRMLLHASGSKWETVAA